MATSTSRRSFERMLRKGFKHECMKRETAVTFFEGALSYSDVPDLITRLTGDDHCMKVLKYALTLDASETFLCTYLLPFVELLGSDAANVGTVRGLSMKLVQIIGEASGVLANISVKYCGLDFPAKESCVAWLLKALIATGEEWRSNTIVLELANRLKDDAPTCPHVKALSVLLAGTALRGRGYGGEDDDNDGPGLCLESARASAPPGSRHSNDKADFRAIQLVPPADQLRCQTPPYLPSPDFSDTSRNPLACEPEAATLDYYFRLLHEDMVGPMHEDVKNAEKSKARVMFEVNRIHCIGGVKTGVGSVGNNAKVSTKPCVMVSFKLPPRLHAALRACDKSKGGRGGPKGGGSKGGGATAAAAASASEDKREVQRRKQVERKRMDVWSEGGVAGRVLKRDSLVLFVQRKRLVRVGVVVRREADELVGDWVHPMIGISFPFSDERSWEDSLMEITHPEPTFLIPASASFFSFEPVLRRLSRMDCVPFAEEVVLGAPPSKPECYDWASISDGLRADETGGGVALRGALGELDDSQSAALRMAFDNRVALIQGPPGTGKTHIGTLAARLILAHTTQRILCICYTNHALDSFVESLLDAGVTDLVRLGSLKKISARVEPYVLQKVAQRRAHGVVEKRVFGSLKRAQEATADQIMKVLAAVQDGSDPHQDVSWWTNDMAPFLELCHSDVSDALTLPDGWEASQGGGGGEDSRGGGVGGD